mgnify:CR=1 FL=1
MPLPTPNLDDRRFEDLVTEAKARLASHLPELTQIAPGDPLHSFVDLFAWLTETILYRANLVPERLRRVFLNLLQIPVRPARAARGLVCVDASPTSILLPRLLVEGSQLKAGKQSLTTSGELQPTCLQLQVTIKKKITATELTTLGLTMQDLQEQFGLRKGEKPTPFQPQRFAPGKDVLSLSGSLDNAFYLGCIAPSRLAGQLPLLREKLAGVTLNVGIAPADELEGDEIHELAPRLLRWELASTGEQGEPIYLPLDVLADSSKGGRQAGVVRLRLPKNPLLFKDFAPVDQMFGGMGEQPPELADDVDASHVVFWLRLRCPDQPALQLGYLGLNAVDVLAQGFKQDQLLGIGTGQPDQVISLPDAHIDATSLLLDVEENGSWVRWQQVDYLAGQPADANIYQLDAQGGYIYFGDGISTGRRPPEGARIRSAAYLYGGGEEGNLAAGSIKELVDGSSRHKLRHEWPLRGGVDAETVEQAEQRIPQFLTHRNRAVTRDDFKRISESNPVVPVARAEVKVGFLPGARIEAARENVPGVVSVFVLPPGKPGLGHTPKPSRGLLKDLFGYLLNRVLIGTELYVLSPEFVPLAISVKIQVRDAETEQQTLRAVQQTLINYLWPLAPGGSGGNGWPLAAEVRSNELMTQVARVEGVLAVNGLSLFDKQKKGWRRLKANQSLTLKDYQLPELLAVRVETGSGTPALPEGLGSADGESSSDQVRGVAVPVIPDIC